MAYPTVSAPYGLRPVKLLSGSPHVGIFRQYPIASGYATAIFNGDAVKLVAAGTVERDAADAAMTPVGVFVGCSYTDPNSGQLVFNHKYPGGVVADDIKAHVVDATDVLFRVAIVSSGTTIGTIAAGDVGGNAALVDNTGDTASGNSRVAMSATVATTATLPVRIVELVEETKTASGYTEALVKWNAGHQMSNTTGV